jgi:hypothetical protein
LVWTWSLLSVGLLKQIRLKRQGRKDDDAFNQKKEMTSSLVVMMDVAPITPGESEKLNSPPTFLASLVIGT